MFKAIIYKEWLKFRYIFLGISLINLIAIIYIYLNVSHDLVFTAPVAYWNSIVFRGTMYYKLYKYVPLFSGIILALAQFIPEVVKNRIKLTFHLPIDENKILLWMAGFGSLLLIALFGLIILVTTILNGIYFPIEITKSVILTLLPWMIGGILIYFILSIVILEPNWLRRLFSGILGFGIFDLLYTSYWYEIFKYNLPILILLLVLLSISILTPGFRFRKGAR